MKVLPKAITDSMQSLSKSHHNYYQTLKEQHSTSYREKNRITKTKLYNKETSEGITIMTSSPIKELQ